MNTHYMQSLDWLILAAYFAILVAIGLWASGKRKKNSSLFLAERSLRWHHIGFSMWGTNVGPSMLIASASAGFTTGVVSGNFAWYAFVFIALLAFVFAPRYLGTKVHTLPEFMGLRFGQDTRNILAWYTIVTVIISWLALTLFAGGILIRQVFDIPMWASAAVLLVISAFFTMLGGLKAVAYTNVYQMVLLIVVSATLTIVGLSHVGGVSALVSKVPPDYWVLFKPNSDPDFPWLPIVLGYPVMGVWFWCTDQSMVQPVLAARSLKEGQLGANFTGWLKILDVFLYILPGIICYALFKDKGYEIVGVSFDQKAEPWKKAIEDLGMTWPQMSDLKGWQCQANEVYGVNSIPSNVLVGPDGKIIAHDLRGETLLEKLETIFRE